MEKRADTEKLEDSRSLISGILALQVVGGLSLALSPMMLGSLIAGLALSESQAGLIIFVEILALSLTALGFAPVLPRIRFKRVCYWAIALAVPANLLTVFADGSFSILVLSRVLAGVGAGFIFAVSIAAVASLAKNPDRIYGVLQIAVASASVLYFAAAGHLSELYTYRGVFGLIGLCTILLLPMLRLLPDRELGEIHQSSGSIGNVGNGVIAYVAVFVFVTGLAALWVFTEPLGVRAGLSRSQIGLVFSLSAVAGLAGAGLATWLHIRMGRVMPITAMVIVYIASAIIICSMQGAATYVVAVNLETLAYFFSIPYCYGVGAALDRQGRWAAAMASALMIGYACGPVVGGYAVEFGGYSALLWVVSGCFTASWLLFMTVIRRLRTADRRGTKA